MDRILRVFPGGWKAAVLAAALAAGPAGHLRAAEATPWPGPAHPLERLSSADNPAAESLAEMPMAATTPSAAETRKPRTRLTCRKPRRCRLRRRPRTARCSWSRLPSRPIGKRGTALSWRDAGPILRPDRSSSARCGWWPKVWTASGRPTSTVGPWPPRLWP